MFVSRLVQAAAAFMLMLALPGISHANDVTFTGQVTYRERIALPANAELWVTLVNLAGNVPVVGAAASVASPAQVPIDFVLDVRSNTLDANAAYGLVAEIRSEGRTMFRNWQPVAVDPLAPAPVLIVVGFSPDPPHDPPMTILPIEDANPLLDTIWRVTSIGGDPVLPATEPTLSIAADLRAGGHGGCNNYFTEADFELTPLGFGPIAGTRMACAPDVMAQEGRLFAALGATADYELSGDALRLLDAAGATLVGLVRAR